MTGLAITSLQLSHFRSHRLTRLELDGRPVAIFGANGAGKTNILEAASLLSPGRGLRRATPDELIRRPESLGWKISARLHGLTGLHDVETGAENGDARFVRIDEKTATQVMLGRIGRVLWLVPSMDRIWIEAAEGRRRFLDRVTLSFRPDHAEAVLAYEKAMRDRNRLLKDQIADAHWYGALEARMAEAAKTIGENRHASVARLMQAQQGAATQFPGVLLRIEAAEAEPDDLTAFWAETRRRDMAAGRTLVGPHRVDLAGELGSKTMPAAQCSTGEQKAMLISLILANARALAEDIGRAPIVLLDEVAAHLDAERRAALYDEICALGAQALMTGTDPALFDSLGQRAQTFAVTDANGISQVV